MLGFQTFGIFDGARDETRIKTYLHSHPLALTDPEIFQSGATFGVTKTKNGPEATQSHISAERTILPPLK